MCMLLVQEYNIMYVTSAGVYMYVYATDTGVYVPVCYCCRGVCVCYWYRTK